MSVKIKNYIPIDKYYVSLLIDPRTNLPFYVGKGTGNRVTCHYHDSRIIVNPYKTHKIKKLKRLGYEPKWKIIFETENEQEAVEEETKTILKWGRKGIDKDGILTNVKLNGEEKLNGSNTKKVDQYDTKGRFMRTFNSVKDAAIFCGITPAVQNHIGKCCRGYKGLAYGFYWNFHGSKFVLEHCFNRKTPRDVYQWDLEGNLIEIHSTLTNAAKTISKTKKMIKANVLSAIKLKTSAYGFQWSYTNHSPGLYIPTPRREIKRELVYQWNFNGILIKTHESIYDAVESLGLSDERSNIVRAIKNKTSAYKFQWTLIYKSPGTYKKKKKSIIIQQLK